MEAFGLALHRPFVPPASLPRIPPNADRARLKEVCQDFEAIFIKQMLDAMRDTLDASGLIDGGMAEEIFEDMLYKERARIMARTGNFGLAELLYNQLKSYV